MYTKIQTNPRKNIQKLALRPTMLLVLVKTILLNLFQKKYYRIKQYKISSSDSSFGFQADQLGPTRVSKL